MAAQVIGPADLRTPGMSNGRFTPQININVANAIGHAGQAQARAWQNVFGGLGDIATALSVHENASRNANFELDLINSSYKLRQETEMNSDVDGSGYRPHPQNADNMVNDLAKKHGVEDKVRERARIVTARSEVPWAYSNHSSKARSYIDSEVLRFTDEASRTITNDPDQYDRVFEAVKSKILAGVGVAYGAAEARKKLDEADRKLSGYRIQGMSKADPEAYLKSLEEMRKRGYTEDGALPPQPGEESTPDQRRKSVYFPLDGKSIDDVPSAGARPRSRDFGVGVRRDKYGQPQNHGGLDIPGKVGEPYRAHQPGVVIATGTGQGYGNYVDVKFEDGTIHRVAHLGNLDKGGAQSPWPQNIKAGTKVNRGDVIGFVGYSGNAGKEFPHAHTEIFATDKAHRESANYSSRDERGISLRLDPREYFKGNRVESEYARRPGVIAPVKTAAEADDGLVDHVKSFEGFKASPYGDGKQTSIGYGTKAQAGDTKLSKEEADTRLRQELSQARSSVEKFAPDAPDGIKKALTSLTFNAGPGWQNDGLGEAIKSGDYAKAKEIFRQYTKADGKELPGLVRRREAEAQWFDAPSGKVADAGITKSDEGTAVAGSSFSVDSKGNAKLKMDLSDVPGLRYQPRQIAQASTRDLAAARKGAQISVYNNALMDLDDAQAQAQLSGEQTVFPQERIDFLRRVLDPGQYRQFEAKYKAVQGAAAIKQAYDTMIDQSPAERNEYLQSLEPTDEDIKSGIGLAEKSARYGVALKAAQTLVEQMNKNPVAFATSTPEGKRIQEIFGSAKTQAQREHAVDMLLAHQRKLGIEEKNVGILTSSMIAKYSAGLSDFSNADRVYQTFEAVNNDYGKHATRAFQELRMKGDVPREVGSFLFATEKGRRHLLNALIEDEALEDRKGSNPTASAPARTARLNQTKEGMRENRELVTEVNKQVKKFTEQLGTVPGGSREDVRSAAERLAFHYHYHGDTVADAVKKATDELYGKRFEVTDSYVAPRNILTDDVKSGLSVLQPFLREMKDQIVPPLGSREGLRADLFQRNYAAQAATHAKWRLRPDMQGFYAVDREGSLIMVRESHDANDPPVPFEMSFKEVSTMYKDLLEKKKVGLSSPLDGVDLTKEKGRAERFRERLESQGAR